MTSETEPAPVALADKLSTSEAAGLRTRLLERLGADLILDGSAVSMLGAQSLQVLLSARQSWAADGKQFEIRNPSRELMDGLGQLGVSPDRVGILEV